MSITSGFNYGSTFEELLPLIRQAGFSHISLAAAAGRSIPATSAKPARRTSAG